MKLTEEQLSVVKDGNNRVVSSCPGSGKTRTIIAKILVCIEEVRGTPRKIGCITYTNAATNEILGRLLEFGATGDDNHYEINTIHSFCLNNIVRPYGYLIDELSAGFEIIGPDSTWFQITVDELIRKYDLARRVSDLFGNIQRSHDGAVIVPDGITALAANEFVRFLNEEKYVTFSDIVYFAFRIVSENKFVARALSSRFAWLLVDEFQDTSELQVELLSAIHRVGNTKFFLVGDQNQSIYGFAGARPDLMDKIAGRIGAVSNISLSGNFRCSAKIIEAAERLCPRNPPMVALGKTKRFHSLPRHIHTSSAQEAILGYFLPEIERLGIAYGNAAILAPWWTSLLPLGRILRSRGIPVLGPGARPYKRSLEFSQFAEAAAAYVICKDAEAAVVVQRALFFMLLQINEEPNWRVFSYFGKRTLCLLLGVAESLHAGNLGAVGWLRAFGKQAGQILRQEEMVKDSGMDSILQSVSAMLLNIEQNVSDASNMAIEELGIFARPRECVQLMTMHAAKGREFDAVAVIDFHEGKVPHFAANAAGIEEAQRLTYVAATRPRKLLVFFSDFSDRRNRPSRFVGTLGMTLTGSG